MFFSIKLYLVKTFAVDWKRNDSASESMHKITRPNNVVNLEEEKRLMHNMHNYRGVYHQDYINSLSPYHT